MTPSRGPRARLARWRTAKAEWLVDYGLWKLHRLEDRLPRETERRLGPLSIDLERALVQATGLDAGRVAAAREEYAAFSRETRSFVNMYAVADARLTELQFVLTRLLRPRVVVETGVWRGLSSWNLLAAMELNGVGRLVSIDFPPLEDTQRVEVGHLVPASLRPRWDLRLGPSRQLLPQVFREYPEVGLFVHDSDHTYFNMRREFRLGWDHLRPGGVLLSDDIDANHSFVKFARSTGRRPLVIAKSGLPGYLGLLPRRSVDGPVGPVGPVGAATDQHTAKL